MTIAFICAALDDNYNKTRNYRPYQKRGKDLGRSRMSLEKTIHLLSPILPASEALSSFRANRLHTAEADAQLHCIVYIALREMSANALA